MNHQVMQATDRGLTPTCTPEVDILIALADNESIMYQKDRLSHKHKYFALAKCRILQFCLHWYVPPGETFRSEFKKRP